MNNHLREHQILVGMKGENQREEYTEVSGPLFPIPLASSPLSPAPSPPAQAGSMRGVGARGKGSSRTKGRGIRAAGIS